MKKRLTKGEKLLFTAPLLFLVVAGASWQWKKSTFQTIGIIEGHSIDALVYSPDSKRLLICYRQALRKPLGDYQFKWVYDLETLRTNWDTGELMNFSTGNKYKADSQPVWSSDGKQIVSSMTDISSFHSPGHITIWDAAIGTNRQLYLVEGRGVTGIGKQIRFSPDNKTLLGSGIPSAIYDPTSGGRLNKPDTRFPQDNSSAKMNENLGLVARENSITGKLQVVDFKTKQVVWKPPVQMLIEYRWSGDILSFCDGRNQPEEQDGPQYRLNLWDGKTRQVLPAPSLPSGVFMGNYSFNADGSRMAYYHNASSNQGRMSEEVYLSVWSPREKRVVWRTSLFNPRIDSIGWSPDGKWLTVVTNGDYFNKKYREYKLSIYDNTGTLHSQFAIGNTIVSWSPDSTQLATVEVVGDKSGKTLPNIIEIHHFKDE